MTKPLYIILPALAALLLLAWPACGKWEEVADA